MAEKNFGNYSGQNLILLADDNPINQEMVKKILVNYGYKVLTALNGSEVLDLIFSKTEFDLILLDINMPVLNGIDTARKIRSSENEEIKNIPIVALTGNETKLEIQEIYQSGINSYVAKPASPEQLIDIVSKSIRNPFFSNKKSDDLFVPESIKKRENEQSEIDINQGVLYVGNDLKIFKKLLSRFYTNYADYLTKINKLIEQNDYKNLKFAIHNLKGTSAQICAVNLYRETAIIEEKIKNNLNSLTNEDIENLNLYFKKTMESINKILSP
ncbi:MAG: Hpt domain-containing response regulator [Thermodesulfobacteriota bacterium]